jgi:hypothetical protein
METTATLFSLQRAYKGVNIKDIYMDELLVLVVFAIFGKNTELGFLSVNGFDDFIESLDES